MEEAPGANEGAAGREDLIVKNGATDVAVDQSEPGRMTVAITDSDVQEAVLAHPIKVTHSEHLSALLVLLYHTYKEVGDKSCLRSMYNAVEEADPGLKYGPYTANMGIDAFMDFEKELSWADAHTVATELKASPQDMKRIDGFFVQVIHDTLRLDQSLQKQVSRRNLGLFLDLCLHSYALEKDTPKDKIVRSTFVLMDIIGKHAEGTTSLTVDYRSDSDSASSTAKMVTLLTTVRSLIRCVEKYKGDTARAIVEQHGGMLKHTSLKDLMMKLSNTRDSAALKLYAEQLGMLHAAMYAGSNYHLSELLSKIDRHLQELLVKAEEQQITE